MNHKQKPYNGDDYFEIGLCPYCDNWTTEDVCYCQKSMIKQSQPIYLITLCFLIILIGSFLYGLLNV